jgi:methionyl-tRNA synthetase
MRYYLTTAIAYANNKPGLHTLYEVIGADVIARWRRMGGDEVRFLTGTDEYSVNIAARALEEGVSPKAFVDRNVELFKESEALLLIAGSIHPHHGCRSHARSSGDGAPLIRRWRHLSRHV